MVEHDLHERHARRILVEDELAADVPLAVDVEKESTHIPVPIDEDPVEMDAGPTLSPSCREQVGIVAGVVDPLELRRSEMNDEEQKDRQSTRLNSSDECASRMPPS